MFCPISRGNTVVLEEAVERVFNGKESKPHRNPSDLLWLICAAMIRGWSVGRVRAGPALSWAPGACRWLRPTTRDFRTGNSSTECTNQRIGSRVVLLWSIIHQCTENLVVECGVACTFVSGPFLYFLYTVIRVLIRYINNTFKHILVIKVKRTILICSNQEYCGLRRRYLTIPLGRVEDERFSNRLSFIFQEMDFAYRVSSFI